MPYKLRKAPDEDKYFVETTETGNRHSKLPISKKKATRQLRVLESRLSSEGSGHGARDMEYWGNTRLELSGSPLRPDQRFSSLYSPESVVTQFH